MQKVTPHLHGTKKAAPTIIKMGVGLLLIFLTTTAYAKPYSIAIISSGNSPIYSLIIDTVKNTVTKSDDHIATFQTFYARNITPAAEHKIGKADLLLTIGQRALISATKFKKSPPILATLIPRQSFTQNLPALKVVNKKVSAVYVDSPPERQVLLAKLLLGELQTVGVLLSENASPGKRKIIPLLKDSNLKFHIENVSTSDNIIRKLSHVINNSDALLAFPDPLVFNRNTARNILLTTYRQRVPVIAFSSNYVKAGALAATFSTPSQIAKQTGVVIKRLLTSPSRFPYGGRYPDNFDIAINGNVARSLGINVPPNATIKTELEKLMVKYK